MDIDAQTYFGSMAAEYDSLVRRAVPVYNALIDRLVLYLPERATRILELGCGTGTLTTALARRYPESEITIVDGSEEMVEVAAARLGRSARLRRMPSAFEELELEPERYDLVTSCLSLHHVVDLLSLFRGIHGALEPGGRLVFGDQMRGCTDRHHALNWNRMVAFWREPGHLGPEEIDSLERHAEVHDHYVPVVRQVELLADAGFTELDVVWRSWMWGVVTGRRRP